MGQIFDFGDIKNNERTIRKTWDEFRAALSIGTFSYDNIEEAKKCTFLKVYNDLFHDNFGIEHSTLKLTDLDGTQVGRGCVLKKDEASDYERFISKREFITDDNRFSPPGVEWLYLALGNETAIHQCAQSECRTHVSDEFGFCHFKFDDAFADIKLVDLTIADNKTYEQLNQVLELRDCLQSGLFTRTQNCFQNRYLNQLMTQQIKELCTHLSRRWHSIIVLLDIPALFMEVQYLKLEEILFCLIRIQRSRVAQLKNIRFHNSQNLQGLL